MNNFNNFESQELNSAEAVAVATEKQEKSPEKRKFLTPEEQKERIEKIKEEVIDVESYKGIVHLTQIPNLRGLLTFGLQTNLSTAEKRKWGYSGFLGGVPHRNDNIYLTILGGDASVRSWKNIPWSGTEQVVLFFRNNIGKVLHDQYNAGKLHTQNIAGGLLSGEKLTEAQALNTVLENPELFYHHTQTFNTPEISLMNCGLSKEYISGLILSPETRELQRKYNQRWFRPKDPKGLAIARLSRMIKDPNAHLVPLYDHEGNVLWPEYIPYEKVKEMVAEREKQHDQPKT